MVTYNVVWIQLLLTRLGVVNQKAVCWEEGERLFNNTDLNGNVFICYWSFYCFNHNFCHNLAFMYFALPCLFVHRQAEGLGQYVPTAFWPVHLKLPSEPGYRHWILLRQLCSESK